MAAKKTVQRGFTLIELVIVIAVIAILAALLVPTILGQAEKARVSRAAGEVNEIGKALARVRTETGSTASTCYSLANLTATTAGGATGCGVTLLCNDKTLQPGGLCWGGPYMATTPANDPWTRAYTVNYDASTASITVKTGGPDSATTVDDITKVF